MRSKYTAGTPPDLMAQTNAMHHQEPKQPMRLKATLPPHRTPVPVEIEESFHEVHTEDSHGVALRAAKEKWNELGPLRLEDIVANSIEPID